MAVWIPRTSRYPSALTPVATITATLTTRPAPRTFIVNASAATNVYRPSCGGRVRHAATCSSRSFAMTDTCDFDRPVIPSVRTSLSIRRVLTPSRWQVATTVVSTASAWRCRSSSHSGKNVPSRTLGIAMSIVPTRVSRSRWRYPLRVLVRWVERVP